MKNSSTKTVRNSGLELLRIVSMFLIILHHACISDSLVIFQSDFCANHIAVAILGIWGTFGVALFFIISAWFMLEKNYVFKIEKIISLILETIVLSVIVLILANIIFHEPVGMKDIIKNLLSPILSTYWFVTVYIIFYFVMPFLRKFLCNLSKQELLLITGILTLIVPVYRSVLSVAPIQSLDLAIYMAVLTMCVKENYAWFEKRAWKGVGILSLSSIAGAILSEYTRGGIWYDVFVNRYSVFLIMDAVFVFILVKEKIHVKSIHINKISECIFGVYILHSSPYIALHLWKDVFNMYDVFRSKSYFGFYLLVSAIVVFVVCYVCSVLIHGILNYITFGGKIVHRLNQWLNI